MGRGVDILLCGIGKSGKAGLCVGALAIFVFSMTACQPTVRVEAPKEPITINLNITLDADVRVKLEEQADKDIEDNPDIF